MIYEVYFPHTAQPGGYLWQASGDQRQTDGQDGGCDMAFYYGQQEKLGRPLR